MLKKFEEWLKYIAKKNDGSNYSDSTVYKYTSSINIIKNEFHINFLSYQNYEELFELKNKLFSNNSFAEKDSRGNRMYSRSVEMFISFIYENEIDQIQNEIAQIQNDKSLTYDEKNSYIESICNIRNPQFQNNFRKELLKEFNCKCALCEINDKRLLIASHIIPYSECINKSDMYRSYNGLLLCVTHDALFDKHMITFNKEGKIYISKDLNNNLYELLNINNEMNLDNRYLTDERKECLKKHMETLKNKLSQQKIDL